MSGWVRLRLPWSDGVVTWFVTDFRTHSNMEQGAHGGPSRRRLGSSRSGGMRRPRERWLARMTQLSSGGGCGVTDR
jgi:hypothetical protein